MISYSSLRILLTLLALTTVTMVAGEDRAGLVFNLLPSLGGESRVTILCRGPGLSTVLSADRAVAPAQTLADAWQRVLNTAGPSNGLQFQLTTPAQEELVSLGLLPDVNTTYDGCDVGVLLMWDVSNRGGGGSRLFQCPPGTIMEAFVPNTRHRRSVASGSRIFQSPGNACVPGFTLEGCPQSGATYVLAPADIGSDWTYTATNEIQDLAPSSTVGTFLFGPNYNNDNDMANSGPTCFDGATISAEPTMAPTLRPTRSPTHAPTRGAFFPPMPTKSPTVTAVITLVLAKVFANEGDVYRTEFFVCPQGLLFSRSVEVLVVDLPLVAIQLLIGDVSALVVALLLRDCYEIIMALGRYFWNDGTPHPNNVSTNGDDEDQYQDDDNGTQSGKDSGTSDGGDENGDDGDAGGDIETIDTGST